MECFFPTKHKIKFVAILVTFMLGSCFLANKSDFNGKMFGWGGVVISVILFFFLVKILFNVGPSLILDELGVNDVLWFGFIPWEDILSLSVIHIKPGYSQEIPMLSLEVADRKAYLARIPFYMRSIVATYPRRYEMSPVCINLSYLTPDVSKIVSYISEIRPEKFQKTTVA